MRKSRGKWGWVGRACVCAIVAMVAGCASQANTPGDPAPLAAAEPSAPETQFETRPSASPEFTNGYFWDAENGETRVEMEVRDGMLVLQGDIVIGTRDRASLPGSSKGLTDVRARLWKDGEVQYELPANFPNRAAVLKAFDEYNQRTKIRFVEKKPGTQDYLKFVTVVSDAIGGQSYLGRTGGAQPLWMNANSSMWSTGTVIHELGHALGLMHEQCRSDRDQYVDIIFENITPGYEQQFSQLFGNGRDLRGYDYASIMHYTETAFGVNGAITIKAKQPGISFGQRKALSTGDIESLSILYAEELAGDNDSNQALAAAE